MNKEQIINTLKFINKRLNKSYNVENIDLRPHLHSARKYYTLKTYINMIKPTNPNWFYKEKKSVLENMSYALETIIMFITPEQLDSLISYIEINILMVAEETAYLGAVIQDI